MVVLPTSDHQIVMLSSHAVLHGDSNVGHTADIAFNPLELTLGKIGIRQCMILLIQHLNWIPAH